MTVPASARVPAEAWPRWVSASSMTSSPSTAAAWNCGRESWAAPASASSYPPPRHLTTGRNGSRKSMRFLICDDHKVFADSLALLIERSGWQVAGIAGDPDQAAVLLAEGGIDLCLLDLSFPSGSALERLPALRELAPMTKFVVLTGFADAATLEAVMAAGAHGVAHKGNEVADLLGLLRKVIEGGRAVVPLQPPVQE